MPQDRHGLAGLAVEMKCSELQPEVVSRPLDYRGAGMDSKLGKCPCCEASISLNAVACPRCGHISSRKGFHYALKWATTVAGSVVCVLMVFDALISGGMSAIQQAAEIAGGVGLAVGPYVYSRATDCFGAFAPIAKRDTGPTPPPL